jgi:hypothetical protein
MYLLQLFLTVMKQHETNYLTWHLLGASKHEDRHTTSHHALIFIVREKKLEIN